MKIKASIGTSNGYIMTEEMVVTSMETAKEEIEKIIEIFNVEEVRRYGNNAVTRELIEILEITDDIVGNHDWEKQNVYTTKEGFDIWQCVNCGLVQKRTMGRPSITGCYPNRVCKIHNKQFASEENLARHNAKFHS